MKFFKGNVCERSILEQAIVGQDAIVHLVAETGTGQSMYEIQKYTDINIGATSLILDILTNTEHSVKKVARAIYGEGRYYSEEKGYVFVRMNNE